MEIVLLEKIQKLGDLGDLVKVRNGYARNYLIPKKKAVRASDEAKSLVAERRRVLAEENSKRLESAKARADLAIREIVVSRLSSEGGKLYGSVTVADIAETLNEAGTRVEKSEVSLPTGPIKNIGEFTAEIHFHSEVKIDIRVLVNSDQEEESAAQSD